MDLKKARKVLGIEDKEIQTKVKRKYKELAKKYHPDLNDSEEAHKRMQEINKAFELVMKEDFGVVDPWEDYHKWWLKQYGNDPIWGNYVDEKRSDKDNDPIAYNIKSLKKQKTKNIVDEFLDKKNVFAVVGVSKNSKKYGNKVYLDLKAAGYKVYPVNPRIDEIRGSKCYPSLNALPELPDVIDIVVPPKITENIVKEAPKLGIKKIWMQPGSESDNAISFCNDNDIQVLHDVCVMVERKRSKK